jgi:hypothetical protein
LSQRVGATARRRQDANAYVNAVVLRSGRAAHLVGRGGFHSSMGPPRLLAPWHIAVVFNTTQVV